MEKEAKQEEEGSFALFSLLLIQNMSPIPWSLRVEVLSLGAGRVRQENKESARKIENKRDSQSSSCCNALLELAGEIDE